MAPLNMMLMNREGLVGDVGTGSHLGHRGHKMLEFSILGEDGRGVSVGICYLGYPQGRLWTV